MAISIKEQIEYLFPKRGRCLKEIACYLATCNRKELSLKYIIKHIGKNYPNSTIYDNFKKLSSPMTELDGQNYIETSVFNNGIGRPQSIGKLSKAAYNRLFSVTHSSKETHPSSIYKLAGMGSVEIPTLAIGDKRVPPKEIIALCEMKIGKDGTAKRLKEILAAKPGTEKSRLQKKIDETARQQGISFKAKKGTDLNFVKDDSYVDPSGDLANDYHKWKSLPDQDQIYMTRSKIRLSEHKVGPIPKKRACITDSGLKELAATQWPLAFSADILLSCDDPPMKCSDPGCNICALKGIKTCWTKEGRRIHR